MRQATILVTGILIYAAAGCGDPSLEPVEQSHQADFVNGGFEGGNLSGWTVNTNLNPNNGPSVFPPMSIANLGLKPGGTNKTVVLQGATPESQIPPGLGMGDSLRYPRFGGYSTLVNQNGSANNSNTLTQTMTTKQADVDALDGKIHVRFALAPILQNPTHTPSEQPYFFIDVRNTTTNTTLFSSFNFSGQPGVPFKNAAGDIGVQYTDWQLFDLAPGPTAIAVGDQITATVIATGCSQGAHYGHVLVDGFGAFIPGLTIVATAPQSANAGTDLIYTFVAKNGGSTAANNVVVTEVLPANTTFVSVSGATCTTPRAGMTGTVTCMLGTLNANAGTTFQLKVHIDPTATGTISNGNYNIAGTGINPLIGPLAQTSVTTGGIYSDLRVTVESPDAAVNWSSPIRYTVIVTNNGPTPVVGAVISNMLPAQLTGVTWTCTGKSGGTCGAASGSGDLSTTASLPVGASVTYSVMGNSIAGSGMGSLNYLVSVRPPTGISDPDTSDNAAVFNTGLGQVAAITVDKGNSSGSGSVTSAPAGISCGPDCTSQSSTFLVGTSVTLTAVAAPGSTFTGWGGACMSAGVAPQCTVDVSQASNVSANFSMPSACPAGCGNFACNQAASACYETCETSDQCSAGSACVAGSCLPPTSGRPVLTGGGFSGCSYGDASGTAGSAAGLAILGLLALLRGRRRFARSATAALT